MSKSFNGSSDHLSTASALVGDGPFTFSAWFNTTNDTATQSIICAAVSAGTSRQQLTTNGADVGDPIAHQTANPSNAQSFSTGGFVVNGWYHGASVVDNAASRTTYLSGVAGTTETTSRPITGMNVTTIGARWNTTLGAYFAGNLAEVAVWNAALTAAEIVSLSKGFSPTKVRPQSLIAYLPFVRNNYDMKGTTFTTSGTGVADHPRIIQ